MIAYLNPPFVVLSVRFSSRHRVKRIGISGGRNCCCAFSPLFIAAQGETRRKGKQPNRKHRLSVRFSSRHRVKRIGISGGRNCCCAFSPLFIAAQGETRRKGKQPNRKHRLSVRFSSRHRVKPMTGMAGKKHIRLSVRFSSRHRVKPVKSTWAGSLTFLSVRFSSRHRVKLVPDFNNSTYRSSFSPLFIAAQGETKMLIDLLAIGVNAEAFLTSTSS